MNTVYHRRRCKYTKYHRYRVERLQTLNLRRTRIEYDTIGQGPHCRHHIQSRQLATAFHMGREVIGNRGRRMRSRPSLPPGARSRHGSAVQGSNAASSFPGASCLRLMRPCISQYSMRKAHRTPAEQKRGVKGRFLIRPTLSCFFFE